MEKLTVVFVSDIIQWGGSTLSMVDMITSLHDRIVPIVLVPGDGAVYRYMKSKNIECYIIPYTLNTFVEKHFLLIGFHRVYSVLHYWIKIQKSRKRIESIFGERKIDIVHSNTSAIDFGYYVARICKAKHVWHVREMLETFENTYSRIGFEKLKDEMSTADKLIFITEACRTFWNINNWDKSVVLGDAVRSKDDLVYYPTKSKYFVFCAQSLSKFKGCDIAIRAFGKSGLANKGYRLKLIGRYREERKQELDKIVADYNIMESVDFLGRVDSDDVKNYMVKATGFLQCSKMEGLGRTSIEAMFYGCPVIAKNCGGSLDFVIDGETGFLWNNEDECSLIMKKVSNMDVTSIIKAAQTLVSEKYNVEDYGDRILKIYTSLF